jgi:hypothetical protein
MYVLHLKLTFKLSLMMIRLERNTKPIISQSVQLDGILIHSLISPLNIVKCLPSNYHDFFLLKAIVTSVKVTFKIHTPVRYVGPIYCMVREIWLGCNVEKSIITYKYCQVTRGGAVG